MSKAWIRSKLSVFIRDVVRDLCLSSQILEEQFRQFDQVGQVEFSVLRDLLGEEANKGLLYRLKDESHHLFRNQLDSRLVGQFLDWGIGYIFHETIKLKEDAYQQQNYGPWFRSLQSMNLPPEEAAVSSELYQVLLQTQESISREIGRIRFILDHLKRLLPIYLSIYRDNALLARFLYDQNDLVRSVFRDLYPELTQAVYGSKPERMFVLASQSLRQGGWLEESVAAVDKAMAVAPDSFLVLQEKEIVDNWIRRLKP